MYSRIINGEEYTFGVSGKLIRNVLVMYDRETQTLWSQLLGEAVSGELQGTQLEYLPSIMTTWENWQEMYPDSLAIVKGYSGSYDPYLDYYDSPSAGVIGKTNYDDRLNTKQFVIGVDAAGQAVAFPFSILTQEPVINYEMAAIPIVVIFDPNTAAGAVWERPLINGEPLTFTSTGEGFMQDQQTGSLWNGITGQAISGELEGYTLSRIKSTQSFWFGWVDFHPETDVYGIGN